MAVNVKDYAYTNDDGELVLDASDAQQYAIAVAKEAVNQVQKNSAAAQKSTNEKGSPIMAKSILGDLSNGAKEAANNILTETQTNTGLITGEILLDNIETLADKLVLSRLSWYQRLTISKKNKELAVTLATYAIIHAIKTGGFGLTKYRIDHALIRFVTLAANQRLMKAVIQATGVDTNIAGLILSVPTVTKIMEGSAE
jgi:hypothetical protein